MDEQLVIFQLAGERYGVSVGRVQSILQMPTITVVPGTSRFIQGVFNLRGAVLPVVNLRNRFDLPLATESQKQVVLIVELGTQQIGMIVDQVTAVTRIPASTIQPPSPLLTNINTGYLRGIAKLDDNVLILLDLDRVFSLDEQQALNEVA